MLVKTARRFTFISSILMILGFAGCADPAQDQNSAAGAQLPLYNTVQNRINQVYWVNRAGCIAEQQPMSVTKNSGPADLHLSLVPAQVFPHQCGGSIAIPGAAVVISRPLVVGETVSFTVHYSMGSSSRHQRP